VLVIGVVDTRGRLWLGTRSSDATGAPLAEREERSCLGGVCGRSDTNLAGRAYLEVVGIEVLKAAGLGEPKDEEERSGGEAYDGTGVEEAWGSVRLKTSSAEGRL
jgi:hypothetical protein